MKIRMILMALAALLCLTSCSDDDSGIQLTQDEIIGDINTGKKIVIMFAAQLITYSLQIALWQDHVAVEYQKILTFGALGTIVATLARTRVLLIVIMYIHHVLISSYE